MGDLIEMFDGGYDGLTCACGGAWFNVQAVALDQEAKVTAWAAPLTCRSCGLVRVDGAWVKPDLTEVLERHTHDEVCMCPKCHGERLTYCRLSRGYPEHQNHHIPECNPEVSDA